MPRVPRHGLVKIERLQNPSCLQAKYVTDPASFVLEACHLFLVMPRDLGSPLVEALLIRNIYQLLLFGLQLFRLLLQCLRSGVGRCSLLPDLRHFGLQLFRCSLVLIACLH